MSSVVYRKCVCVPLPFTEEHQILLVGRPQYYHNNNLEKLNMRKLQKTPRGSTLQLLRQSALLTKIISRLTTEAVLGPAVAEPRE